MEVVDPEPSVPVGSVVVVSSDDCVGSVTVVWELPVVLDHPSVADGAAHPAGGCQ